MKILIVEDEKRLADTLSDIVRREGYDAFIANDGDAGLERALSGEFDLVILDIMLPGVNGLDILREMRGEKISIPVILLTARRDTDERVKGLDSGADYYLTKPFETSELLACIRAVSRRGAQIVEQIPSFGDVTLSLSSAELCCGERRIALRKKELDVMELLMRSDGRLVSKETLLLKVWGYDSDAEYNNVEVYVSFLRKKLLFVSSRVEIATSRGIGYRLEVRDDK